MYDFLRVINNLNSISHRSRLQRRDVDRSCHPVNGISFESRSQIHQAKVNWIFEILLNENRVIIASVLLSEYTNVIDDYRRQTTNRQHIMTITKPSHKIAMFG